MVDAALEATELLLVETGYESATTTRIAERAGISIGSLYQYFSNRDAIFAELQRRHHLNAAKVLKAAFSDARGLPLEAAVRALVKTTARLHLDAPELHKVLRDTVPLSVNAESRSALLKTIDAAHKNWLLTHKDSLSFTDFDATALVIRETVDAGIHSALQHGSSTVDTVSEELSTMLIAYLQSRTAKPAAEQGPLVPPA